MRDFDIKTGIDWSAPPPTKEDVEHFELMNLLDTHFEKLLPLITEEV